MHRKVPLITIAIFVFACFFNMVSPAHASEKVAQNSIKIKPVEHSVVSPDKPEKVPMDSGAAAVVPDSKFDFGVAYENSDVFHDFMIKNEGTADLKIINVKSG